jgi:hypothetical protein
MVIIIAGIQGIRYTTVNPERGERMIRGDLIAPSGMTFTRKELRSVIRDVDVDGVEERSDFLRKRIVRCEDFFLLPI